MAYSGCTGDWKWKREEFGLPFHYNKFEICEDCFAVSGPGELNFADARDEAPWTKKRRLLTDLLAEVDKKDSSFPLTELLGYHNQSFFEDTMHDDLLGLRGHMNGGALKELCDAGVFGPFSDIGAWDERLDAQLQAAFVHFNDWAADRFIQHSQPMFTHLQLSMKVKTREPVLKSKAKNSQVVSQWLADVAAAHQDDLYGKIRAMTLRAFDDFFHLVHATRFPNWKRILDWTEWIVTNRYDSLRSVTIP